MARRMTKTAAAMATIALIVGSAWADQFDGRFAVEVVFIDYDGDGASEDALGPPDGTTTHLDDVDLDRGAITLRFGDLAAFDYGASVSIPAGTDVVIVETTGGIDGPYPAIYFGFAESPTDIDANGIADEAIYLGRIIGQAFYPEGSAPWTPWAQRLLFADLSCGDQPRGSAADLVLAIDDLPGGDFNLNAAQYVQCHGCIGDLNCDNAVALADLSLLLAHFGSCEADAGWFAPADIDCRGCVGLEDLSLLLARYGTSCP